MSDVTSHFEHWQWWILANERLVRRWIFSRPKFPVLAKRWYENGRGHKRNISKLNKLFRAAEVFERLGIRVWFKCLKLHSEICIASLAAWVETVSERCRIVMGLLHGPSWAVLCKVVDRYLSRGTCTPHWNIGKCLTDLEICYNSFSRLKRTVGWLEQRLYYAISFYVLVLFLVGAPPVVFWNSHSACNMHYKKMLHAIKVYQFNLLHWSSKASDQRQGKQQVESSSFFMGQLTGYSSSNSLLSLVQKMV